MNRINQLDFLVIKELDIEHKLLVPTLELYTHLNLQVRVLYHDIRQALIDGHVWVASVAKQFYAQPEETARVWYDKSVQGSEAAQAYIQVELLPKLEASYQAWDLKLTGRPGGISQNLQAFWDNPGDIAVAKFETVSQAITASTAQALQTFMDNPEAFMASLVAPASDYMRWFGDELEALLISIYYLLQDLADMLMAQPSATMQALYSQAVAGLLEIYSGAISALLAML